MSEAAVCGVAVVVFFLGYVAGYRSGLKAMPPPRIVPLKPGARRIVPLRARRKPPRGVKRRG